MYYIYLLIYNSVIVTLYHQMTLALFLRDSYVQHRS